MQKNCTSFIYLKYYFKLCIKIIFKIQRFSIAFHFFMPLYQGASFNRIRLDFYFKRLASEKVIGLWVGVQSLIIQKLAAAFSEKLKILRHFYFYYIYFFSFLIMGAIGIDGICVVLNCMSSSRISLITWKNHKCR